MEKIVLEDVYKNLDEFFYRVKSGDTLYSLSEKFSLPITYIINLNHIEEDIYDGQMLYLKRLHGKEIEVEALDTISSLSEKYKLDFNEVMQKNHADFLYPSMILII